VHVRRLVWLPWGIVTIAAVLRGYGLAHGELWFDEAYAALVSAEPMRDLVADVSRDSSPPLYYVLLHGWRAVWGGSAIALRSLSALAGVASVVLLVRVASILWPRRVAARMGVLLAVSPIHLYYSQEARPYGVFVLWTLVALLGFVRLSRREATMGDAATFSVGALLAAYTHNYGLFLLVPLGAAAALGYVSARLAAASAGLFFLGYLPWMPVLMAQVRSGAAHWVERIWEGTPPWLALPKSLAAMAIGGAAPAYVPNGASALPGWIHLLALTVLVVLALRAMRPIDDGTRLYLLWLGGIVAVPYAASFVMPIYVVGRYDIAAAPIVLSLVALGWARLQARAAWACTAALLCLTVLGASAYARRPVLDGAADQAALLVKATRESDAVVTIGLARTPLEYYVACRTAKVRFYSYPTDVARHRGWLDEQALRDPALMRDDARALVHQLASRASGRLWVVHSALLGYATAVMYEELARKFVPAPCGNGAEQLGITCWSRIGAAPAAAL
jgi:uncharacterized membrane protein